MNGTEWEGWRIQNSPAPDRRTFVHDSLRRFSRSRSMQLVINSALERNSLAKRERLEKSCWNASCTPICKMLVVSLDFFPFIILSNIHSLSLLICFATATTTAALTDCIMMNQKKRETCCFFLAAVVNYSSPFPFLLIDSECFIDNQWKICLMSLRYARVLASKYEWNGTWYSEASRMGCWDWLWFMQRSRINSGSNCIMFLIAWTLNSDLTFANDWNLRNMSRAALGISRESTGNFMICGVCFSLTCSRVLHRRSSDNNFSQFFVPKLMAELRL